LEVARRKGRLVGRPRVMDAQKIKEAKKLLKEENKILKEMADALKVSRTTVFRYLKDDDLSDWKRLIFF
jgi:DNA invertase Pin-like site-specific DNA recombinase